MMVILNTLGPIALLMSLGAILRRSGFLPAPFFTQTNKLLFWICLPALLFLKTNEAGSGLFAHANTSVVVTIGMFGVIAVSTLVARLSHYPNAIATAVIQGSFRGNLVYIGLPAIRFASLEIMPEEADAVLDMALLTFAAMVPLYNIAAVIVLTHARGEKMSLKDRAAACLNRTLRNPLVLSCLLGALTGALSLHPPAFIERSAMELADTAFALSLLAVGARLSPRAIGRNWHPVAMGAFFKSLISPAIGLLLGMTGLLTPPEMLVVLILLATPTALSSYVMAEQFGADADTAAGIIALSTATAIPVLALVLVYMQHVA
jgi:predicted permease